MPGAGNTQLDVMQGVLTTIPVAGTDMIVGVVPYPAELIAVGFFFGAVLTGPTALIWEVDRRITPASDVGRIANIFGVCTGVAAMGFGEQLYVRPLQTLGRILVEPGDELVFDITAPPTSGNGMPIIWLRPLPMQPDVFVAMNETTAT